MYDANYSWNVDPEDVEILLSGYDAALAAQSAAPADRELRTGAHLLQTARSLGWVDDGEGALEFMLRRTREVAIEDCRESVGWGDDYPKDQS
jgi:hypothetical protein